MKYLVSLAVVLCWLDSFGQRFVVTPNGLRDADNAENSHVVLLVEGQTAAELFERAVRFMNEYQKNPTDAVKSEIPGEYLRYSTYDPSSIFYDSRGYKIPFNAHYTTELRFKDGKVRFELTELKMLNSVNTGEIGFTGSPWDGVFPIFDKNGEPHKGNISNKQAVEDYFNEYLTILTKYLKGENNTGDW